LQATPPTRVNFSSVIYYLLGHSAELLLKAFLFKQGAPITDLKKMSHDLKKLVACAKEKGLPDVLHLQQILGLAEIYISKRFEYRKRKREELPNIDLIAEEIINLQSIVFDFIFEQKPIHYLGYTPAPVDY
jgi:hypothetical protein